MSNTRDVGVPTFITGQIEKVELDFCMDGAGYIIRTISNDVFNIARLKGKDDTRNKQLEEAAKKKGEEKEIFTVAGFYKKSTECSYLEVYDVSLIGTTKELNVFKR